MLRRVAWPATQKAPPQPGSKRIPESVSRNPSLTHGEASRRWERQQGEPSLLWQHYPVAETHRTLGGPNQSPPKQGLLGSGAIKAARSPAPQPGCCAGLPGSSRGPPPGKLSSRKQATLHGSLHFITCQVERIPAWCGVGGRFAPGSGVVLATGGRGAQRGPPCQFTHCRWSPFTFGSSF